MRFGTILAVALAGTAAPALAQSSVRPSLDNSFRLGTGGDALCQVQSVSVDPAIATMFDRVYSIVCRDAVKPVGRIYALRKSGGDPLARLTQIRAATAQCGGGGTTTAFDELRNVTSEQCKLTDAEVGYRVYTHDAGRTVYVAEGLAGYDSALTLGLRTVVADRIVPGEISIAATDVGDPAAFARVQAGTLDVDQARDEGYRRNNSGNYAEAAEFFDTLLERSQEGDNQRYIGEFLINRALQRSNLGNFQEADALFREAERYATSDPVQLRLRRNFRALHLMNQRKFGEADTLLQQPLPAMTATAGPATRDAVITPAAADIINSSLPLAQQLSGARTASLTPEERAAILDAQAELLRGTIDRIEGNAAAADTTVNAALASLMAIREGRVTSIARLRSQGLNELSLLAEARNDYAEAETLLREAVAVLAIEYPNSIAVAAANARLAAYLARRGQTEAAIALYREIVSRAGDGALSTNVSGDMLAPYFALLAREVPRRPELADDFFLAGETLVRPGVASTQAVLARELSAGDDEAARLFRQSVNLTREVEQARVELARLNADDATAGAVDPQQVLSLADQLKTLEEAQAVTQAKLSEFPRFRALSTQALTLADLRAVMRPDEAYVKMSTVGQTVYTMVVTPSDAAVYRAPISAAQLETAVDTIRGTIALDRDGQTYTYPFDLAASRKLYVDLFGPLAPKLTSAKHIIFEPAGAMLKLPPNLLVTDDASLATYAKAAPRDDFDFRGVAWLGRDHDISTAVSARAFRDVRGVPASSAKLEYLGLGQNTPVPPVVRLTSAPARGSNALVDCSWPLAGWNNPISARELRTAQGIIGANEAQLITGDQFTDEAIRKQRDFSQYRILHFATHGLVTAPRPECPAQPALLTSFERDAAGDLTSDGLLTFKEIFDLRLDADLVILSACDTAGAADAAATREAGLGSGGNFALDGLVRAFVGAGGRSVVASHWPAPDDYGATEELISGLFKAPAGTPTVEALRIAQRELMDKAATSHPYYWSGFAIVGDGARPVLRTQ
ncbi:CHAT domain-containing protein [Allosphingosinicella indica]|uniref:CHAT domain-containing protein n=1 Tax=Allosphingosinicella indica TaxID=941907 RepID=A0A1X7GK34_9SPHN|nr:CHAT domain-containing protein [Allosphingosinicella indica]SMF70841.1 CHAT domain-containing protein [Allosphingosinicella indica]